MRTTESATHNQYQKDYFSGELKRTMVPSGTPYLRRQVEELVRFSGATGQERVLEVGCGMGRYSLLLAERLPRLEGLDLTARQLERFRQFHRGHLDIPLHCADIADPPAHLLGGFDLAVGFFMLHHLSDLAACFAGVNRMLRPGGRMVFLEPNPFNPLYYLQIAFTSGMTWRAEGGMVQLRRGVLRDAVARAGMCDLAIERFGFFPPFLANRKAGAAVESVLERFPLWRGALPFQLIAADRPGR